MIKSYKIFEQSIRNFIQESGLDVGVTYYILKDIYKDLEKTYYDLLRLEIEEESKKEEKNGEKYIINYS